MLVFQPALILSCLLNLIYAGDEPRLGQNTQHESKSFINAISKQMEYSFDIEIYNDIRSVLKKHLLDKLELLKLNISGPCLKRTLEFSAALKNNDKWALQSKHLVLFLKCSKVRPKRD
jgi:hypothetical protein